VSSLHNNLGMVLTREGRVPEAVDHFRKAVGLFPRSLNGHLNLGNIAFDGNRFADAIAEYEIAQSISPDNRMVQERLGNARRAYAADRR
jgi:protein O-mannosyl-transferase